MAAPLFKSRGGTTRQERDVRSILSRAVRRSGKRRDEIAKEMAAALGCEITEGTIREFTRNADPKRRRYARFPAAWVVAFCKATGDDELQRYLLPEHLQLALRSRDVARAARQELARAVAELDGILSLEPGGRADP